MAPFFFLFFFFHTSAAGLYLLSLTSVKAVAHIRNDNFSSTQLHDPYGVGKLSISRAKTCNFSSVGCEKKNLRLSIGQLIYLNEIFLARDGTFFSFLFLPYLSVAQYLQYAPAIPVCSILQPCVSPRQKSGCRGLLDARNT